MGRNIEFNETEVLQKALEAFWQIGYIQSSTRDLALKTGISYSSLYNRFKDKQCLFLDVLSLYEQQYLQPLIDIFDQDKPVQSTVQLVLDLIINDAVSQAKGCLMVNTMLEVRDDAVIVPQLQRMMNRVEQAMIGYFIRTGQVADPNALAKYMVLQLTGIRVMARAGYNREYFESVKEQILSTV